MSGTAMQEMISRRRFLGASAALAISSGLAAAESGSKPGRVFAYVGSYTSRSGNGLGIELFEVNPDTGELKRVGLAAAVPNPSWIAIHPTGKYLYTVNEIDSFDGHSGSVTALTINQHTGALNTINTVNSEGAGPAYVSLDAPGKFAFVANYKAGTVCVLPIDGEGSLGAAVDVHRNTGKVGSTRAASAPPGSFAISGHDSPHVHMIAPDPENRFVLASDLGQDRIYIYRLNPETGKLSPLSGAPFVSLPSGDGPRHFAFHPNGCWLYSLQEEASTIVFFHFDPATGSLKAQQALCTLPPRFAGTSFASGILIAPDGKAVYALNRLHNTIAVCAIGADGQLRYLTETPTMGDYPVQCRMDPSSSFLYVCNQRSDNITVFKINRENGLLTFLDQYTPVGTPACITFWTSPTR